MVITEKIVVYNIRLYTNVGLSVRRQLWGLLVNT